MTALPRPPAHVAPYVDLLGPERAVALLLSFGGSRLYLARDPGGRSEAEALLGRDGMEALCSLRPGEVIRVPTCRRWLSHVLKARGLSVNEIARRLHVTDVAIWKYLRDAPDGSSRPTGAAPDDRQLRLF
jgi:hypothetical protein